MNIKFEIQKLENRIKVAEIEFKSEDKNFVLPKNLTEKIRGVSLRGFKKGEVKVYKYAHFLLKAFDLLEEFKKLPFVTIKNFEVVRTDPKKHRVTYSKNPDEIREINFEAHVGDAAVFYFYIGGKKHKSGVHHVTNKIIRYEWKINSNYKPRSY